jgi:hypothetical protein
MWLGTLDAQHDAAQAYIRSQAHAGWTLVRTRYDDGGGDPRETATFSSKGRVSSALSINQQNNRHLSRARLNASE